jgi:hypothetical protein
MEKIPFTVYDFFGYLASGFVVLIAITAAFVGYKPLRHTPNTLVGLLLLVVAYVTGHIVANLAGDIVERRVVRNRLGMPTEILMGARHPRHAVRFLLPGYSTPLPTGVQERIATRANAQGVMDRTEALFFHCHAKMKSDPTVQARLDLFLNLYGFCRNMSVALVLSAIALGVGQIIGSAQTGPDIGPMWWLGAALLAAVGLFYRYLKFLRQYGLELLTSYAESA